MPSESFDKHLIPRGDDNVSAEEQKAPTIEELASKCDLSIKKNFFGSEFIIYGKTETGKYIKITYGVYGDTLKPRAWLNNSDEEVSPELAVYLLSVYRPVAEYIKNNSKK